MSVRKCLRVVELTGAALLARHLVVLSREYDQVVVELRQLRFERSTLRVQLLTERAYRYQLQQDWQKFTDLRLEAERVEAERLQQLFALMRATGLMVEADTSKAGGLVTLTDRESGGEFGLAFDTPTQSELYAGEASLPLRFTQRRVENLDEVLAFIARHLAVD